MSAQDDSHLKRASDLHRRTLVIDTHCDTTQRLLDPNWDFAARHDAGHVDLPRLMEGGVDAAFFAVWAKGPTSLGEGPAAARRQIELIHELGEAFPERLAIVRTADEIRAAAAEGRFAILVAIEGGYLIDDSLDVLREFHRLGATYLTLTHAFHTNWADSSGIEKSLEPRHGGLSDFGKEVIHELNRLGVMVDVSHSSDQTVRDVLETSSAPVIATHSSCRTVAPHLRNLSDELMRAIAEAGGVIQINFAASFIDSTFPKIPWKDVQRWFDAGLQGGPLTDHVTPLSVLADHVEHAIRLVGPDHVGIGSDFDGVPQLPEDMEDCSKLPNLTAELLRRGLSEADLTPVLGANVLRVMDECRRIADDHDDT